MGPLDGARWSSADALRASFPEHIGSRADPPSRGGGTRDAQVPFEELIATLTRQKDDLRRLHETATKAERRKAYLLDRPVAEAEPEETQLAPSQFHGSAAYSFGKPRHRKGRFGLEVLDLRDAGYVPPGLQVPGAGTYNLPHTDGRDLPLTDGHTGGWHVSDHILFKQTLRDFHDNAGPEFFDRLAFRLPGMPRKAFTDHLRWLAAFELERAQKGRRVTRWIRGVGKAAEEPPSPVDEGERQQQAEVAWRSRELRDQADAEDARAGLADREITYQAHQRFDGQVLEGNMRGHPGYRKAAGYTFGTSREPRDLTVKRTTRLSGVRSTSALEVPGPGHYTGVAEKAPLLERRPCYGLKDRLPPQKVDRTTPAGPGYDGPQDAGMQVQGDLRILQRSAPAFSFGREAQRCENMSNERKALRDKFSTNNGVGPGSYKWPVSMLTQATFLSAGVSSAPSW